jgi:hypothetical protein
MNIEIAVQSFVDPRLQLYLPITCHLILTEPEDLSTN